MPEPQEQGWALGAARAVALVCFLFSGFCGLVYEVVWTRMLTQVFGNTTFAIATVLAAFMAGLALGSYLFGRLADRGRDYLLWYALLEGGVGIYGLLVLAVLGLTPLLYARLYRLIEVSFVAYSLALFGLAFVIILVPTVLMGATLPVLSRFFVTRFQQLGRRLGDLYAINTAGAVVGCAAAGFVLIPTLGLRASTILAAAINLGIAALIIGLRWAAPWAMAPRVVEEGAGPRPAGARVRRTPLEVLVLAGFGLSGAAAMILENAWTRALTMVIGSSTYSFTLMLTTFLIGLAAGSFLYARTWGGRSVRAAGFGGLEIAIGLAALATIPLFEELPFLFLRLRRGFADSFEMLLAVQGSVAFLVMIGPTLLLGATFPVVARLFTQSLYTLASSVGTAYACNTLGAIGGAFLGGFVLIPLVGVQGSIYVAVGLALATGVSLVLADPAPRLAPRLVASGLAAGALAGALLLVPRWDRAVVTSGVTVYPDKFDKYPSKRLMREAMHRDALLFYREGLTATISVHRQRTDEYLYLRTNGKVDSSYGDEVTMLLTGYLPLLMHPRAEQAMIIGFGAGMTAKAVATFPVRAIEVAEIEGAMIEAARFFEKKNGRIHADPRLRLITADGRNYMVGTPARYDVIISQPSNPWIAGIGNLYTREFYALARRKLSPNGIFAQWLQNYNMSPDDLRMVLRTFAEGFDDVSLWAVDEADFILIGSARPQAFDLAGFREAYRSNATLRADLSRFGLEDPYSLAGLYLMGRAEILRLAAGAEVNSDDLPRLEFSAPKNLGRSTGMLNWNFLKPFMVRPAVRGLNGVDDPAGRRHYALARGYASIADGERALPELDRAIALGPREVAYQLLRVKVLSREGRTREAAEALSQAMALQPSRADLAPLLEVITEWEGEDGIPALRRIVEAWPDWLDAAVALGDALRWKEKNAEAEQVYLRARALAPADGRVLLGLGKIALERAEPQRAATLLEQALRSGTGPAHHYATLGEAYHYVGRHADAVAQLRQALRLDAEQVRWRRLLASSLAKLGRTRDAERELRDVLALDPSNTKAWEVLHSLGIRY